MLFQDVRYAFRVLLTNRAFTLVAVLSLAVGIGANSAMFSFADALLLRPLPVLHPSEVVTLQSKTSRAQPGILSYPDYVDFRDRSQSFDGLVAFSLTSFGYSASADALPQVKYGLMVSGNFFQELGVTPGLGRGFRPDEDQVPGRDAVAVLGYDFWTQQFGAAPDAIGRTIRLNGVDFTVIGVAPKEFTGMDQYLRLPLFIPLHMAPRLAADAAKPLLETRDRRGLEVKGRLKPGVPIARAQAELQAIAKSLEQTYPATNHDQSVIVRTEFEKRVEQSPGDATLVAMLLTLSVLVLLVACANVANLLLSRARARSREIALRMAIGAGRTRLVRQLLTESLLIGVGGGVLAIAVAYGGITFMNQLQIPTELPIALTFRLDLRTLLFGVAGCITSVLLFGLIPALQTTRTDLVRSLKSADADSGGRQRIWGRNLLVIGQVAVSLVLLILSARMYRAVAHELQAGPGYRTDHLLTMTFDPSLVKFNETQTRQFYKQLVDRAANMPGVKSVALSSVIPMLPVQEGKSIVPEGYKFSKGTESVALLSATVDDHYFDTMGVPVVRGRGFQTGDNGTAPKVAIVNEVLAAKYWPDQDPVGKRFRLDNAQGQLVQIVGVAKTSKYIFISEPPLEFLYLPLSQNPKSRMTMLVESLGDARSLMAPVREAVRGLDSNQPIYDVHTMQDFFQQRAVKTPNMIVQTVGTMGLMGLLLAMVGLYGLVAYSVSRRTREFGIRMAIGAESRQVLRMVMRQGLRLSLAGIAIGLVLSLGAVRVLKAAFSTGPSDPATMVTVPLVLLAVTLLAAYIPALRASRVAPMKALRYE